MVDERGAGSRVRAQWERKSWALFAIEMLVFMAAVWFKPLARLGLEEFEARHGSWVEIVPVALLFGLLRWAHIRFFKREETRADWAALLKEMRENPPKRMSLSARSVALLLGATLVVAGSLIPGQDGRGFLVIGVPMFLLFVLVELNFLLRPGDTVIPDPHDELLNFFKARTLQVGYVTAILSLAALCVLGLFEPRYVETLLPVVLTTCLLVPAFAYRRLDRRASADG
jgi:hypothetical protein